MLTEKTTIDQITLLADGQIQLRRRLSFINDDVEVAFSYHRYVIAPGDDLSKETKRVRDIANIVHTALVISAYRAKQEA
tara:strand:- start:846 stop:1082 length:237 start_codon:yes stop_codon:yes gene_type:complete